MTASVPAGPSLQYLGSALFMLGVAYTVMRWVGRTMREQLGPGVARVDGAAVMVPVDTVPPNLVKLAIERKYVTAAQLAAMAPMERKFLFATMQERLAAPASAAATVAAATAPIGAGLPSTATAPAVPKPPIKSSAPPLPPHAMNGAEFGVAAMPVNEKLHLHCPMCGYALDLPAFAPFVGHCARCGTRTALREDVPGHYILNVGPLSTSAVAPPRPTA